MADTNNAFIRVHYDTMVNTFKTILQQQGIDAAKASACAEIFATNSLEGVYTHGVNRFPRFMQYIRDGYVKMNAEPSLVHQAGALEQWNGNLGPGPLNAITSTNRAIELASTQGLGCVALANTNHWMRGGYYGWQAARKGYVFIGWTNTQGNMPAWGATDSKLGNNPLVIAVPYNDDAIVLDTAMSQYSYGTLDLYRLKGEKLPTVGGYDANGTLTDDAPSIISSRRALPIGFWKGAGLSLLLDVLATVLSAGSSTAEITKRPAEYGLSQVFIAISTAKLSNSNMISQSIKQIIDDYHASIPEQKGKTVRYPGERLKATREENLAKGIPVAEKVWQEITSL